MCINTNTNYLFMSIALSSLFPRLGMILLALFLSSVPAIALAQDGEPASSDSQEEEVTDENTENTDEQTKLVVKAEAGKDRNILVGRIVLFDASASTVPQNTTVSYEWNFGDGNTGSGIDATHIYASSGTYRVTLTVRAANAETIAVNEDNIIVSVQDRLILLITDQSVPQERIDALQSYALTQDALVVPVRDQGINQEYLTVQNIAQQLLKQPDDLTSANMIVTWTSGNVGLNSLIELGRVASLNTINLDDFGIDSKAVIAINDQSLVSSVKIAQAALQSLHPEYIVVSDSKILDDVIRAKTPERLQLDLAGTDADYQIITEYSERGLQQLGPLNFLSYAMNYMINHGVPINSLYLILMLPIMATIIAAARQIVGIKSFGIFVPTVTALSFLATGLKYGLLIFLAIFLVGTIARFFARRFRLLYLPRMAIVLSILAFTVFGMFLLGAYLDTQGLIAISIFPLLIMTVLSEHFISAQIEQGYKTAIKLTNSDPCVPRVSTAHLCIQLHVR
jgi:PKD repeat protein